MGMSYTYRSPVAPFVGAALRNSLKLGAVAFVIVVPLGILGGVVAALNRRALDRPHHHADRAVGDGGAGIRLRHRADPGLRRRGSTSFRSPRPRRRAPAPLTQIYYLLLPSMPLVLVLFGYIARMARAGTVEALEADYTRTAVLKGLPLAHRDLAARAAQRAAADHHGGGHAGRLPDRRPRGDRDAVPLPGHRQPDLHGRARRTTSRCWRRAC